jgi:hypothetical protein
MARIRTVKPEFFEHEELQDLERDHAALKPMLVFAGLWGHCDKNGVFEWKPRVLKLRILPFLDYDIEQSLALLEGAGQLQSFEHEGKKFGVIPSFREHQRITGKEHDAPSKFPDPPVNQRGNTRGTNKVHTGETPEQHPGAQEGKGREGGKEGKGKGTGQHPPEPVDNGDNSDEASGGSQEDFSGKSSPPSEPSPRKGERRNGDFEDINSAVSKVLAAGLVKPGDYSGIARLAHVSALQAEIAVRQLRDRGVIPKASAA